LQQALLSGRGIAMEAVVKKWGNSLGIRIPNPIVRALSLRDGSFVDINDKGKCITIKPIVKHNLLKMVKDITDQNRHDEIEDYGPTGKEIW
jgi:antitoxin MazE